jgi:hypothetical protein
MFLEDLDLLSWIPTSPPSVSTAYCVFQFTAIQRANHLAESGFTASFITSEKLHIPPASIAGPPAMFFAMIANDSVITKVYRTYQVIRMPLRVLELPNSLS